MHLDPFSTIEDAATLASTGGAVAFLAASGRQARLAFAAANALHLKAGATKIRRTYGLESIQYPGGGLLLFAGIQQAEALLAERTWYAISCPDVDLHLALPLTRHLQRGGRLMSRPTARPATSRAA